MLKAIKKLTGMILFRKLGFTVLILLTVFLFGCAASEASGLLVDPNPVYPQYYQTVWETIGQKADAVIEHMGLESADFQFDGYAYLFNKKVEFLNNSFEMRLTPFRKEEGGNIQGVEYRMLLEPTEEAVGKILQLQKDLWAAYGAAENRNLDAPGVLDAKQLTSVINAGKTWDSANNICWILTKEVPEVVRTEFAQTCWELNFRVLYSNEEDGDPTTQGKVLVFLTYSLRQEPGDK